jgi:hypothetical protein
MLIKLNYNVGKSPAQVWRVFADICNNTSVNSISALRARASAASYNADLLSNLVDSTSYIVRTTNITSGNTITHIVV